MQPSLLQVKSIQLTKIAVEALATNSAEQVIDDCEVQIFRHQDVPNSWKVTLIVYFGANRQNARYSGSIGLIGEFTTAETLSEEAAENLINVNGPSILYSSAREIILNFTALCPNGVWLLPSVTFIGRKKVNLTVQGQTIPAVQE